jgi:hypothetical protein
MDTPSLPPTGGETIAELFSASLQLHRDSVNDFLAAQRERFQRAEAALEEQIDLLEQKLKEIELQGEEDGNAPSRGSGRSGGIDWEEEKRRVIAMLEGGTVDQPSAPNPDRLKIEEVLRTTDLVIAEKNHEIEELKKRQAEPQDRGEEPEREGPIEPVDLIKVLDSHPAIQEEKKRLQELQAEWKEKLRQAEIDLSMERAQLARLRNELDAKARAAEKVPPIPTADSKAGENAAQHPGSRWLSQLGLTDADRERARRK